MLLKYTDKRISGIHVTLLAAMINQSQFLHKLYVFKLIDSFGIFAPQGVIMVISVVTWVMLRSRYLTLSEKPLKSWHVSDWVLKKKQD